MIETMFVAAATEISKETAKKVAEKAAIKGVCAGASKVTGTMVQKNVATATNKKKDDLIPLLAKGGITALFAAISTAAILLLDE